MKDNKTISEFMNCENTQAITEDYWSLDWNWLMEVVAKIESLGYQVNINTFEVYICEHELSDNISRELTKANNQTKWYNKK